ncbi:MAG: DUF1801 domain-containing protein [Candidatus Heimdallarchaeota archaeon]|nr:MAG: DUF1801 domain-containing protein [Candidatus Heimdallarchaeota archaeon]
MSNLKTQKTQTNVEEFLNSVPNETKREDSLCILELMQEVTGEEPVMWGTSIIGFGSFHYKYASGREGNWFLTGFSPRKQSLSLYVMPGFKKYESLLANLGKYETGKSCIYINKLADIDKDILRELIRESTIHMKEQSRNDWFLL